MIFRKKPKIKKKFYIKLVKGFAVIHDTDNTFWELNFRFVHHAERYIKFHCDKYDIQHCFHMHSIQYT